MSRSFQIVEDKLEEAEFFLEKLHFKNTDFIQFDFKTAYFYLSAFLSATRSITFCLQASLSDLKNFESWYQEQQNKLKASDLAKFFLEARNLSQKVGYCPLGGGRMHRDENCVPQVELHFDYQNEEGPKYIPKTDLLTACKSYFIQLLEIIVECYRNFGEIIDPEKYYTMENMTEKGLTVEDFEEQLGFERGWTEDEELTIEDRVNLLRAHAPQTAINWIFIKHLGTDRFGTPVNENSEDIAACLQRNA